MFAALSYGEEAVGRFSRWRRKIFGERIVPQKKAVGRGACFFVAEVTPGARIRWDELFVCMGKLSREMVLPDDLAIPAGCGITRFVPQTLEPRLVMNTAAELLARSGSTRIPVTVFDPHGRLCSMVIPIVRTCADVRIVTSNLALYRRAGERMMEEYGASIQIRPQGEETLHGGIAVFPFGMGDVPVPADTAAIVPAGDPAGDRILSIRGVRLAEELRALKPSGISDFLFASALYEKCALREIGSLTGAEITRGGEPVSWQAAAALLSAWRGEIT